MATVQRHIHLDTTLDEGPELAPVQKWVAIDRIEEPVVIMSLRRSLKGNTLLSILKDDEGDEVQLTNYYYTIKVAATSTETYLQRKASLKALHGRRAYLVDHEHCDDGENHTDYIKPVIVRSVGRFPKDDTLLRFCYVEVELEDDSIEQE